MLRLKYICNQFYVFFIILEFYPNLKDQYAAEFVRPAT